MHMHPCMETTHSSIWKRELELQYAFVFTFQLPVSLLGRERMYISRACLLVWSTLVFYYDLPFDIFPLSGLFITRANTVMLEKELSICTPHAYLVLVGRGQSGEVLCLGRESSSQKSITSQWLYLLAYVWHGTMLNPVWINKDHFARLNLLSYSFSL